MEAIHVAVWGTAQDRRAHAGGGAAGPAGGWDDVETAAARLGLQIVEDDAP